MAVLDTQSRKLRAYGSGSGFQSYIKQARALWQEPKRFVHVPFKYVTTARENLDQVQFGWNSLSYTTPKMTVTSSNGNYRVLPALTIDNISNVTTAAFVILHGGGTYTKTITTPTEDVWHYWSVTVDDDGHVGLWMDGVEIEHKTGLTKYATAGTYFDFYVLTKGNGGAGDAADASIWVDGIGYGMQISSTGPVTDNDLYRTDEHGVGGDSSYANFERLPTTGSYSAADDTGTAYDADAWVLKLGQMFRTAAYGVFAASNSTSWQTNRDATTATYTANHGLNNNTFGQRLSSGTHTLARLAIQHDTSTIPDAVMPTVARLYMYGYATNNSKPHIVKFLGADSPANADFNDFDFNGTLFFDGGGWATSDFNKLTLLSPADLINKTGRTKIGVIGELDYLNTPPGATYDLRSGSNSPGSTALSYSLFVEWIERVDATVTADAGNAAAAGGGATIRSNAPSVLASGGNALAGGGTATIRGSYTITATGGNATATGGTSTFRSNAIVSALSAAADAAGGLATLIATALLHAIGGNADASGGEVNVYPPPVVPVHEWGTQDTFAFLWQTDEGKKEDHWHTYDPEPNTFEDEFDDEEYYQANKVTWQRGG